MTPTATVFPNKDRPRYILTATLFLGLSIAATAAIPFIKSPFEDFNYYGIPINRAAPGFSLMNIEGKQVNPEDYRGQFVYLMFGYLGCDEVCHTQALTFHVLNQQLSDSPVKFLYLGMDPENDTPDKIADYFDARADNFDGLIANDIKHAQQVAASYHAYFSVEPAQKKGIRKINHPGYIYLIDPEGQLRIVYKGNNLNTEKMFRDLEHLRSEFS